MQQKKEKNSRSSLLYPLRAWHKPALSGIEGGFLYDFFGSVVNSGGDILENIVSLCYG